jgi:hypothetical protein
MPLIELWSGETIVLTGFFTIAGLIIIHGHKWITAYTDFCSKTREWRQPDDSTQDQCAVGGAYPDRQSFLDRHPLPSPDRQQPDVERVPDHRAAASDRHTPPPAEQVDPLKKNRVDLLR